jgi:two-component system CheB/CheR fusion protein
MGLGLALARSIAEAHGGQIGATSPGEGRGAEFRVRLRLVEPPPIEAPPAPKPKRTFAGTIVVVEDQDDSREVVCALLRRCGFRVVPAADGAEGLRAILEHRPRFALVDVGLPGLDGLQVARRVRAELGAGGPFLVALTGYGQERDREAVRAAGFDRHLVKPFEFERLLEVLAQADEGDGGVSLT